ncbi:MAG: membrane dipeptidase [Gammaproteobacteria bacterium]|nr:MAG: membrane dipeptidase [Gammaproteobacteria bacterium]
MIRIRALAAALLALAGLTGCSPPSDAEAVIQDQDAFAQARAMHDRFITLDTHLDTPVHFSRPGWDIMERHDFFTDRSQVDYPRMREGGLDGGFWVVFTQQGPRTPEGHAMALDHALLVTMRIREMVARNHEHFELALTASDAQRIVDAGKKVVYISIENGYPLNTNPRLLETFYHLGVRMFGPVHFANNELGDSATDRGGPEWNGLSEAGKAFVAEANRLGMVLDASHASDDVFDDLLELSATPIVLSHSGVRAIYDHPRNRDDERLLRLAESGGVIQMNAFGAYLRPVQQPPGRTTALRELREEFGSILGMPSEQVAAMAERRREIDEQFPVDHPDLDDFMAHLLYALELIGVDHVGIGADWDGGGGVEGMWDVAAMPLITQRLLEAGYDQDDLAKVWSGNVLRLLEAAEDHAEMLAAAD